jgi:predicted phage terminase large subunit-like protein
MTGKEQDIAKQKRINDIKHRLAELEPQIMMGEARENYAAYVELVHQGQYIHARHTRLICDKLQLIHEGKLRRLAIFLPPRHSKSQTVTETFPSWFIGKDPDRRVIQLSYGDDLASDFGLSNMQKVQEYGKVLFNIELDPDKQAKGDWAIKGHSGYMRSAGAQTGVTGKGAHLFIVDDPLKNEEDADSEVIRDKIYAVYRAVALTRLTPNGAIILIMTRWHNDDLAARILAIEKDWEIINLPFEAEENDLLGRKVGDPLWPEFGFNVQWMADMKPRLGSRVWNAQYQQRPSSASGDMLKRSWWKYYRELPQMAVKLISIDATFKDGKTSDYVAIGVWGKARANIYLIDLINDRMDFPTTIHTLLNIKEKHKDVSQILIEEKANGSAIIQSLRSELGGIIGVEPLGGKVARVNLVSAHIEAGNVYIPQLAPFTSDFVEQCAAFPNGKYDDMVDQMSQALARLIYMQAALPEGDKPYDEFLHGKKPVNPFESVITDSFISYGCRR